MRRIRLRLGPESRIPLRAAVAASIALAVGDVLHPPRWYWAVLVSVLFVSGTWGENTQRALSRFGMTAFGCVVAWALHHLCGGRHLPRVAVLLAAIFLAAYFRGHSYGWFTFFITVYVVFLFDILHQPTAQITITRVYQTFIGCAVALAASLVVPMPRSQHQWEDEAAKFWQTCREQLRRSYDRLLGPDREAPGETEAGDVAPSIIGQLNLLYAHQRASRYETPSHPDVWRRRRAVMDGALGLAQLVLAMDQVTKAMMHCPEHQPATPLPDRLRADLAALRDETLRRVGASPVSPAPAPVKLATAAGTEPGARETAPPAPTHLSDRLRHASADLHRQAPDMARCVAAVAELSGELANRCAAPVARAK